MLLNFLVRLGVVLGGVLKCSFISFAWIYCLMLAWKLYRLRGDDAGMLQDTEEAPHFLGS